MTRGYVCITNGNKVKSVAYLSSDAYLSWYGIRILNNIKDGRIENFINDERKENRAVYKEDPCAGFSLNWIKPDKESKKYSDWNYTEYGYIYDERTNKLKVYNNGKLLLTAVVSDYERYKLIFENSNDIYHALSYDENILDYKKPYRACIKIAEKLNLEELKKLAADNKEYVILDDYHCIEAGHNVGHETYSKTLYSTDSNKKRLKFIVQHDAIFSDYGWSVLLQTPFFRCELSIGNYKYGKFRSEKSAVNGIRELVRKIGADKMFRTAEIFSEYKEARDNNTISEFLNELDGKWKENPWYATEKFNCKAIKENCRRFL